MFRESLPLSASRILLTVLFTLGCISFAAAGTETVLHQFVGLSRGGFPGTVLTADAQGNFYGTTSGGGDYGFGTVFKLAQNSSGKWNQTVIYSFTGLADGNNTIPYQGGGLVFDKHGNLYGTASEGGSSSCYCGVVYELSPGSNGSWKQTVLYSFTGGTTDGANPTGTLALDAEGNLFGTTQYGGLTYPAGACPASSCGTAFQLIHSSSGWSKNIIHFFTGKNEGTNPTTGMIFDSLGNLYGTTSSDPLASTVFELTRSSGWKLTTLHTFIAAGDASNPNGLVFDASGNLFGAAYQGGTNGFGAVFELSPGSGGWTESILYSFVGGTDGVSPAGNVIFDGSGNLLGTTYNGGNGSGDGVVYKLTPTGGGTWTESVAYSFNGKADGANPKAALTLAASGHLFGTTYQGSAANVGAIFELVPSSGAYTENQIFSFPTTDGSQLTGGLVADNAGNLYGTTNTGGEYYCPIVGNGCGTVFKLARLSNGTWQRTVLHNFTGTQNGDGGGPHAGLIFDSVGNLYGTTSNSIYGGGTVFKLSPSGTGWSFRTIYTFGKHFNDGQDPFGNLMMDAAGNLYGTTISGGNGSYLNCNYCGTVFKLAPTASGRWTESVIYNFQGLGDGSVPMSNMIADAAGNLYGTTNEGGIYGGGNGCGVVFKLSPNSNGTWTQTVLYSFTCASDGSGSEAGLVMDSSGNLYGTTSGGGGGAHCNYGCGVVFELSPTSGGSWNETVIYDFGGFPDGAYPIAGLTFDSAGNLYGTTNGGGLETNPYCFQGCGTVFKLTPSGGAWIESLLYSFTGPLSDGSTPAAGVILDSAGNLYGTTSGGGINGYQYLAGGTVFQITP
jgi:uncharacterized repeat protein (TIGR03803 family)